MNGLNRRRMKIAKNKINLIAKDGDIKKLMAIISYANNKLTEHAKQIKEGNNGARSIRNSNS